MSGVPPGPLPDRLTLEAAGGGYWRYPIVDFAFLRNMHFPTPAILAALSARLPELLWSYGSKQTTLDALMAELLGCDPAHVVALGGLSQIYPWLAAHLSRGSTFGHVLAPAPTFGEYDRLFPGRASYRDPFALGPADLAALSERAHAHEVVVFVNPNNPTGTVVPSAAILAFADAHPAKRILVDESFLRFSSEPSLIATLESAPRANVVVLASLSKDLGMPGLRLGYAYARDPSFIGALRAALPIWNLSALAEHVLELMREHRADFERSLVQTRDDRARFAAALGALEGVVVHAGGANFVVASLPCDALAAARIADDLLAAHGLLVKDISAKVGDGRGHFRLAVRGDAEHEALVVALAGALTAFSGTRGSDSAR